MNATAKQESFFNKIKAMVVKTSRSIIWRGHSQDNDISEKIAQKIQKNSYDFSQQFHKDTFTPPYLSLVEQLEVDDEQIFQAAVFNLTNIAKSRNRYSQDIIGILDNYLQKDSHKLERKDYVAHKLNEIHKLIKK
ncbi:MAG: hypothetical protein IJW72_04280 [Alphaproteobacteria bacterium]|nr:hypothetical protein [Alphaproteobacteria bacterium]MBQ7285450.1 hypothetical protein [Alphaproteobacteria bacterium]